MKGVNTLLSIVRYSETDAPAWDEFVKSSWNGTFIHTRKYLAYHQSRFEDHSAILRDSNGKWVGLFPAAVDPDDPHMITSHPGITFGGVVHRGKLVGPAMIEALETICQFYSAREYQRLRYRSIPLIYHQVPSEDDRYALFRLGATIFRCDLFSVVNVVSPPSMSPQLPRKIAQGNSVNLVVHQGKDLLPKVWEVLSEQLKLRHNSTPVHSLAEIQDLFERFPSRLQCRASYAGDTMASAVITYDFGRVIRLQYSTATDFGRGVNATAWLLHRLLLSARAIGTTWFDFSSSNGNDGHVINEGLHRFKSQFGASGVAHQFYEVSL